MSEGRIDLGPLLRRMAPTPSKIADLLGAASTGHDLECSELASIYARHRDMPTVKLKRELWSRLLATAFGTGFTDSDALFVNHTLLVMTADVIAHAAMGFDLATLPSAAMLSVPTVSLEMATRQIRLAPMA